LASHVLSLFAAAASESLSAAINADLFFLHERGYWMGVYSFVLQAGGPIGSIASGFAIQALGWRWHLWVLSFPIIRLTSAMWDRRWCESYCDVPFPPRDAILSSLQH
jgi:MFS family permease